MLTVCAKFLAPIFDWLAKVAKVTPMSARSASIPRTRMSTTPRRWGEAAVGSMIRIHDFVLPLMIILISRPGRRCPRFDLVRQGRPIGKSLSFSVKSCRMVNDLTYFPVGS